MLEGRRAWILGLLAASLVVVATLIVPARSRRSDGAEARTAFVARCAARAELAACERQLAAHHDACLAATFRRASRTGPEEFDRAAYLDCVERGHAGWLEHKRALAREREARKAVYAE